jgi:RNA polymerase-binding transcription factor DksA
MDDDRARKLLEDRRRDLEQVLRAAKDQAGPAPGDDELASYDQHPADMATETAERTQFFSVIETTEASLRDLEKAVARLGEGKYGICLACGDPIPDERLEAIPETAYDVEHAPQSPAA